MKTKNQSVLFLGAEDNEHTDKALAFCRLHFKECTAHLAQWGDPLPEGIERWKGDYIISHLSRWIIPASLLSNAEIASINFHPGPPEYPGTGCNNFALYDQADEYGTTCHHMAADVDTGAIIAVRRFPVFETDNVASLLERTHDHQLSLFYEIASLIVSGKALPACSENWTRKPFTRTELNQLGIITTDMSKEEIKRRVRATNFGRWKPVIEHHGFTFQLETPPAADVQPPASTRNTS